MGSSAERETRVPATSAPELAPSPATYETGNEHFLLRMQRTMGNQAVLRLIRSQGAGDGLIQRQPAGANAVKAPAPTKPDIVDVGTFFVTNAQPTDEKFALRMGKEDAQTIHASPSLTAELRSDLNGKLRFFKGNAKNIYGATIKTALEEMGGGVANIGKVDHDLTGLLQAFTSAAHDGVHLFTTKELSNRIDQLESGSMKTFLLGLLGNGIWAATVFFPVTTLTEKAIVFAVASAGIGIAAAPGMPSPTADPLPEVERLMYSYFDAYEADVKKMALAEAMTIIQASPAIHVDDVINSLMPHYFRPAHYRRDSVGKVEIDTAKIREEVASAAEDKWTRYQAEIVPIGKHNYLPGSSEIPSGTDIDTQLVWASQGGRQYLTRISSMESTTFIWSSKSVSFESFIDEDLKDSAIARAGQAQPSGIAVVSATEISGFPRAIPGKIVAK